MDDESGDGKGFVVEKSVVVNVKVRSVMLRGGEGELPNATDGEERVDGRPVLFRPLIRRKPTRSASLFESRRRKRLSSLYCRAASQRA